MQPIHLRNVPPPPETFNHPAFFSFLFSYIKPENYLELGVRDGRSFLAVAKYCKKATGVDTIKPMFELEPNMIYHVMTTDKYFKNVLPEGEMFDAVFIDADHSHKQSLKDFMNVKDKVIEDGFIFLHDTYPFDPSYIHPKLCNEVYKTALYIKEHFSDDFEILTFPFNPGVTVIKKMARNKQLIYLDN